MGHNSKEYDRMASEIFAPIYPDIAKAIIDRTGVSGGELLDLGSGGGHIGFALMELGDFRTTFCDISEDALKIAEKRAGKLGVEAEYVHGDVHEMVFPDETFDLVASRGSMPFWDDQIKAFTEIFRVLRPGGKAYIGGGLGGKEHQERIHKFMDEHDTGFKCFDRSKSKALETAAYLDLFNELEADYEIVDNEDEGRWFIFGKRK